VLYKMAYGTDKVDHHAPVEAPAEEPAHQADDDPSLVAIGTAPGKH
jgi:hypothetical protein